MNENRPVQSRVPSKQKIALALFGLFLFFVVLEISLRLGGFVLSSIQESRNLRSIKQKGAYRILCLGESTTQNQYPQFLEQILNQRSVGVRFSVIDKGVVAITTADILNRIESYLDEYHPDMVITMMGINDRGEYVSLEASSRSRIAALFRSLRTYKLVKLLWLRIATKFREAIIYKPNENGENYGKGQAYLPKIELNKHFVGLASTEDTLKNLTFKYKIYIVIGQLYRDQGRVSEAEALFKKAIELNPESDKAYDALGRLYISQGKASEAEALFKKAIELNPETDNYAYGELGQLDRDQDKASEAKDLFKKAEELNPKDYEYYIELGRLYRGQDKAFEAEDLFNKSIKLNPETDNSAYGELGRLYISQGKFSQAEDLYKKVLELNPKIDNYAYAELGRLYISQGRAFEAEALFKKAIKLNPKSDGSIYGELGRLYIIQGRVSEAEALFKKAIELNPESDKAYDALGRLYISQGKASRPGDLYQETPRSNPKENCISCRQGHYLVKQLTRTEPEYFANTLNNYRRLKEILDKRGIKLVCAQYPMCNVGPLQKIFEKDKGVIFVDNERIFKEAIKKSSYNEYFVDMFAGDFGHCTEKGNRLLARNIAEVILSQKFK